MQENEKKRRWPRLVLLLVLLAGMFVLTAYAASYLTREVKDNYFQTGEISIDLNGGKAVIGPEEYLFEPGMTVIKDFYLENTGTWAVYYKLYFAQAEGPLADVLEVSIRDEGGKELFAGTLSGMTRLATATADDVLEVGQRKNFTITFHFPEEAGNRAQNRKLHFILCADAVQTKNNPNRDFD